MKQFDIVKKIAVSNFVVSLVKESEALVYSTVPTESNDGGIMISYVDPLHDKMLYATLRQMFDMACNGDKVGEALIANYCIIVFMAKGCAIVDAKCVNDISNAVRSMYVRVKSNTDKAGEDLGIKEETSEEALNKLREIEELSELK